MNDISIYLSPVEKKTTNFDVGQIGESIIEYNDNFPILESKSVALIFIPEYRGNKEKNLDSIRDYFSDSFYQLYRGDGWGFKIYNIGFIKPGKELNDSYFAIAKVSSELIKNNILPIIIGGSQDLTLAMYDAYQSLEQTINTCSIDYSLDIGDIEEEPKSNGYLTHLLIKRPCYLFNHANIGLQAPHVSKKDLELFNKLYFDSCTLGDFNSDFKKAEPHLRNSDLVSFDMQSIKKIETNFSNGNINGFFADQACQITYYAGISDKLTSIGFFNYPIDEPQLNGSKVLSELIWYLIKGYNDRKNDFPKGTKKNYTKFEVKLKQINESIIFYKSDKSARWWMEVPFPPKQGNKYERHHLVPCDYDDYKKAMNNEIPNLWWKTYQKLQ